MKFENVKVDDILVLRSSGRLNHAEYFNVKVTKVTKTRFKTTNPYYSTEFEWTKDGKQYPRPTGWNRAYYDLYFPTEEGMSEAQQLSRARNKFLSALNRVKDIDSNTLTQMDVQKLLDTALLLEQVVESVRVENECGAV